MLPENAAPDLELQPEPPESDPAAYAIRRVREVVADAHLIQREPKPEVAAEPEPKANVEWQLRVWSGPRKGKQRALGMADMGGTRDARPNDGARSKS